MINPADLEKLRAARESRGRVEVIVAHGHFVYINGGLVEYVRGDFAATPCADSPSPRPAG